jgi:hypothetical protein
VTLLSAAPSQVEALEPEFCLLPSGADVADFDRVGHERVRRLRRRQGKCLCRRTESLQRRERAVSAIRKLWGHCSRGRTTAGLIRRKSFDISGYVHQGPAQQIVSVATLAVLGTHAIERQIGQKATRSAS